jgi:uncharacterized protein (DUF1800 family)
MAEREKVAHLLRRASFGPTAEEVDAAESAGWEATLSTVLGASDPKLGPPVPSITSDPIDSLPREATGEQREAARKLRETQTQMIYEWWLDRMVAAGSQLEEKIVFFWHGHWATSIEKVDSPHLMLMQHKTFRQYGQGDFSHFAKAMVRDPALILWLDNQKNSRRAPNENLARELMELFTLGIGNYTEDDVKAGARALTGWTVDRGPGRARFESGRYDAGDKTILGQTGKFDADGFVDILLNRPASPRFIAKRVWFRFASGEEMSEATLHRLVSAYSIGKGLTTLMQAVFTDPAFAATRGHLVKQPVEWMVGAMRQLAIRPSAMGEADRKAVRDHLQGMQQTLYRPPSVGGWPSGATWLTSHTSQVRLRAAEFLANKTGTTTIAKLNAAPQQGRPDALARLLVVDAWTPRTRAVLDGAAKDVRKLLALGLISPEYSVQ